MGAEKDIIIAVELASTAIRAIAGKREPDGSMQVLAFAQEESSNTIRKGIIDNIDKTTLALSRVVAKLSDKLGSRINSIYVGLGGQSLRSVHNRVLLQFDGVELLSHKTIDKMHDTNSGVVYSNAEIKEVIPQEFTIGSRSVVDPVGMQAEMLEANFINIIARSTLEENIRRCVNGAGLEVQDVFISPLCVANTLLTANEKRSGCTLVDMGADTTTVSVYSNNILRHLCVIPLGGSNVTSDITNLKVEAEEAEELKKKYGTAFRPDKEDKTEKKITLSFDRTEKEETLQEIVEARYEEIIANVCQRISPFKEKMLSGIVVTGGAARIPDLTEAFGRASDLNVRIVKGMPENITVSHGVQIGEPDRLYTLYSLLLAGKENCVGELAKEHTQDTFDFGKEEEEAPVEPETPEPQPEEQDVPKKKEPSSFSRLWKKIEVLFSDESDGEENS
ncbi:MAG: cell division protein FtsA [Bacteroidaceae bacterium]|nr:cell division protein FtsA [Bacteroidaceae bacterium]MBQ2292688.1 cell division protein FtsA [Bacteroidaceae bacterium]MBQ2301539.1 cell division protein FtsA [Bacteroidaceae bacterium]MBQ5621969.1 cell division protein FtsA [Bacteroidaceae bacterium]MBQ5713402.1 cell division protein FtsA [Bacteroidaceae bacterium]